MGFFSKLMFWKKDELAELDKDLGMDKGFGAGNLDMDMGSQDWGSPAPRGMPDMTNFQGVGDRRSQYEMNQSLHQQLGQNYMDSSFSSISPKQSYQEVPQGSNAQLEVISAKLDSIKASLDAINQRLANLERAAYPETQPRRRDFW